MEPKIQPTDDGPEPNFAQTFWARPSSRVSQFEANLRNRLGLKSSIVGLKSTFFFFRSLSVGQNAEMLLQQR